MTETTWFERALDDHPLARDLLLVGFLVVSYGGGMSLVLGWPWVLGLSSGVMFAALWLAWAEWYARRRDESMFRYFLGGDPLE